jgi:two-component system chemotaxis response regulator CheB
MAEVSAPSIRVLVIDDSAVVRRLLTQILDSDPLIAVVGTAPDAQIAMEKIAQLAPDVVTLDVEMPEVSGLELLARIRRHHPKLPVIMFSSLTQRAAGITLEALALGATDYVTKPTQTGSRENSEAHVREQLIPKIKALGGGRIATFARSAAAQPAKPLARRTTVPVNVVAVGASTGGPNALATLFGALPADLPVPVLITQHMPPLFTRLLAERLTASGPLRFKEAGDGDVLEAGTVLIAPGDYHMKLESSAGVIRISLDQGAPENSCRPAVDVLFRSAARIYGAGTLAIVLTGMGQDGLKGAELLRAQGAQIVVQDEASSVVWGMPGFIARAGLADAILPLERIAGELLRRVPTPAAPSRAAGASSWK